MSFKKLLCTSLFSVLCFIGFVSNTNSQDRSRIIENQPIPESAPTRTTTTTTQTKQRPTLTNEITIKRQKPLVEKTSSSRPINAPTAPASENNRTALSAVLKSRMMSSIQGKLGIPYRYGSNGPNRYDCSSFVWAVFGDMGINFMRTSARSYWNTFEPVSGDDRFKFGTLVFFNRLGHVGIVVDKEGFYHASSSKGVTYSKFEGYWENRIVGYRRVPLEDYLY